MTKKLWLAKLQLAVPNRSVLPAVSVLLCVLAGIACSSENAPEQAEKREYSFAVTDVEGNVELVRDYDEFRRLVEERTHLRIRFFPVANRAAAIAGIEHGKADLFLLLTTA